MAQTSILAKMAVQIVANNAQFAAAMKQSQAQMRTFQRTAEGLGSTMRSFGVGIGLFELARGVQFAINTVADFERTMSEVKAITGATGKEFKDLEGDAKRLGLSTRYTASQVAELQIAYGRLGFTTKEILDATEATLSLATATGEDLAKSADVAGSTVRGFGLDASETLRVVDVMASSFNKTALGLENFTESMKYVAPIGNAAGATVEEVTAMLGILADSGVRGSMAGTSLRKIFTDMTKDGRPLQERLAELAAKGITLADSFDEVGRTAQTSLLILSKNTDKLNTLTKELQNASGEAAKMAGIMEDNLTGDVTKLTSAMEGFILKFSDGAGSLREFVQALTDLVMLIADDDIIKGIKAWFSVATVVPRKTLQLIKTIIESFKEEGDAFKEMQERRRKYWESITKKQLNDEIKKTKEAAEATRQYAAAYSSLIKKIGFVTPTPDRRPIGLGDPDDFINNHPSIDMDPLSSFDRDWADRPVPGVAAEIQQNEDLAESLKELGKLEEDRIDRMMRTADMAQTMGAAIGEAFTEMIKGEQSFAQSLARITEQIISLYLQQSIAGIIKAAVDDPSTPFPFAKVAIAAAGIGAVKALFNGIGGSSSAGGGASVMGRLPSEANSGRADFRVSGYDLRSVGSKDDYRRSRVG